MKFSTPGHSCVQEIDSVHSCIEKVLPYKIIQMYVKDFKDYKSCTTAFNYKVVPFSNECSKVYTKNV